MADINKAIKELGLADWAKKAHDENEMELKKVLSMPPDAKAKLDLKAQTQLVETAGQKAVAAATKDAADLTKLLKDYATHSRDMKQPEKEIDKMEAIGRKHHLTEAQIKKALKDAGY